jgi:hypothetical protein
VKAWLRRLRPAARDRDHVESVLRIRRGMVQVGDDPIVFAPADFSPADVGALASGGSACCTPCPHGCRRVRDGDSSQASGPDAKRRPDDDLWMETVPVRGSGESAAAFRRRLARVVVMCSGCGRWWSDDETCQCTCSDPADPRYEAWHVTRLVL